MRKDSRWFPPASSSKYLTDLHQPLLTRTASCTLPPRWRKDYRWIPPASQRKYCMQTSPCLLEEGLLTGLMGRQRLNFPLALGENTNTSPSHLRMNESMKFGPCGLVPPYFGCIPALPASWRKVHCLPPEERDCTTCLLKKRSALPVSWRKEVHCLPPEEKECTACHLKSKLPASWRMDCKQIPPAS